MKETTSMLLEFIVIVCKGIADYAKCQMLGLTHEFPVGHCHDDAWYDRKGRLVRVMTPGGADYRYKYDSKGNRVFEKDDQGWWRRSEYDSQGRCVHMWDSSGTWYWTEFDGDGNACSKSYNGYNAEARVHDKNGHCTFFLDVTGSKLEKWKRDPGRKWVAKNPMALNLG